MDVWVTGEAVPLGLIDWVTRSVIGVNQATRVRMAPVEPHAPETGGRLNRFVKVL